MDEHAAQAVADRWSGGAGLVPRGPKIVLATRPVTPSDVERHTGARPRHTSSLWRIEVGGRFLRSGGLVYPGGVPFPEELQRQTAVIANEVWLYVDDGGDLLGLYWWPDAVRRPIASVPRDEYDAEDVLSVADARARLAGPVRVPSSPPWEPVLAVRTSEREAIFFLTQGPTPDPVHEMLVFEQGGLTLHTRIGEDSLDIDAFVRDHSPPYRRLRAPGRAAIGRESGRSLGPQTWPWPAELRWRDAGVVYELKGFVPLATLATVASAAP